MHRGVKAVSYTHLEHPDAKLYMYHDGSLDADVAYDYTDVDAEGNPVDNIQFVEDYWLSLIHI